jgi:hypothetical protein
MTRRRADPTALVWKPVAAVRRFLEQGHGGYLTLSTVDAERREAQLGRLETGAEPAQGWVVRLVRTHMEVVVEARFRLRRWGAGGKPAGSVTFVVSRPAAASAAPPAPTGRDDLVRRLAAVEAGAAASHERISRLERRLAAAEQLIELMKPVVAASEQALLILGAADDEDS